MAAKLEPEEWNYREMRRQIEKFLPYIEDFGCSGEWRPVSMQFLRESRTNSLAEFVGWVECNPEAAEALVGRFEN